LKSKFEQDAEWLNIDGLNGLGLPSLKLGAPGSLCVFFGVELWNIERLYGVV
jgi:hypothetical protein